jgi:flagellar hook-basal body complex protein FliE
VVTNRVDINQVLMQMRALKAETQGIPVGGADFNPSQSVNPAEKSNFSDMMVKAVNQVSENQQAASKLATAFEMGDPNVGITEVMIAAQKSSVSFEALSQVRNKLVKAYEDIMNMPV